MIKRFHKTTDNSDNDNKILNVEKLFKLCVM